MNDSDTTISQLRQGITRFSSLRGWDRDENAKDLAMALSVEAAELMEIFQWIPADKARAIGEDAQALAHLREEIADVFWYLMRICEHFRIDLAQAVQDKSLKNALKYPELRR